MFLKMLLFTAVIVALMMIGLGIKMLFSKKHSPAGGCCGSKNSKNPNSCSCSNE